MTLLAATGIIVFINVLLGLTTVLQAKRRKPSLLFFAMTILLITWICFNYLADSPVSYGLALFSTRMTFAATSALAGVFLLFGYEFPIRVERLRTLVVLLVATLPLSFFTFSFTRLIVERVIQSTQGVEVVFGPLAVAFLGFFAVYMLSAFVLLAYKLLKNKGVVRRQIIYVFTGTFLTAFFGLLFNLILPLVTQSSTSSKYGTFFTVFFVAFTSIAIIQHHLFRIKVIATEVFAGVLLTLLSVQLLFSRGPFDFILRTIVLIAALIVCIVLVRSVLSEVKRREEIERLNRQLGDFLRFGTHELRSPLGGIRGYTSLILDGSFGACSPQLTTTVQKIQSEVDHLLLVVETFLDANRARSGNMEVVIEPTDIQEAIKKATQTLKASFDLKNLKLITKISKSLPRIHADPRKIQIVLGNLLSNSLKYTEKGTVAVSAMQQNDKVIVRVNDTGIGISPSVLPHLFTQFERGSDRAKKMATGSGIGLYLTKKLVDAMKGTIAISSEGVGKGTTVTLAFLKASK